MGAKDINRLSTSELFDAIQEYRFMNDLPEEVDNLIVELLCRWKDERFVDLNAFKQEMSKCQIMPIMPDTGEKRSSQGFETRMICAYAKGMGDAAANVSVYAEDFLNES